MYYFEVLDTQEDVLQKIESLKDEGYYEEDIHLLSKDDDFDAISYTDVHFHHHVQGSSLKDLFSSNSSAEHFLQEKRIDDAEKDMYLNHINDGKYVLYYSDVNKRERDALTNETPI